MSEDTVQYSEGWVCTGCGKHVTGKIRAYTCRDCGGRFARATPERLACDRCGATDALSVINSDHDRLCPDCIDYENSTRENHDSP